MSDITEFRKLKDEFFRGHWQSPLTAEQKKNFHGLTYYPENLALRFELPLEKYDQPERVTMQTSKGDAQTYWQVGQIRFEASGEAAVLQVYEPEDGGDYFIPFVDATAPAETYGAGRYLEPERIGEDKILVDFNVSYNPYCAYNDRWSCPFPPPANRLTVRIEAGEKNFETNEPH